MKYNKGFSVLMVMILTSIILLGFSFWIFNKRANVNPPSVVTSNDEQVLPAVLEWTGFSNTAFGVVFQYPKNVFVSPQGQAVGGTSSTRIFMGTGNIGTMTVTVLNRQFDSRNIIDPSAGKISDATAINVANTTGYQYMTNKDNCSSKVVQIPHGPRIAMFSFASCDFDQSPKLSEDEGLMLQILGGVKLTAVVPEQIEESIDSLPPR